MVRHVGKNIAGNYEYVHKASNHEYLRPSFKFCWLWIFPWIELSWHSCYMRDKPGWLNWFSQFLWEGLSSSNPEGFYSYALSRTLCERRTSFCTELSSRKLCRLLMFSTGFTLLSVLLLFPLSITFVFMNSFLCYFI